MTEIVPLAALIGPKTEASAAPSDVALGFEAMILEGVGPPGVPPPPPPDPGQREEEATTQEPNARSKKPDQPLAANLSRTQPEWRFLPGAFEGVPLPAFERPGLARDQGPGSPPSGSPIVIPAGLHVRPAVGTIPMAALSSEGWQAAAGIPLGDSSLDALGSATEVRRSPLEILPGDPAQNGPASTTGSVRSPSATLPGALAADSWPAPSALDRAQVPHRSPMEPTLWAGGAPLAIHDAAAEDAALSSSIPPERDASLRVLGTQLDPSEVKSIRSIVVEEFAPPREAERVPGVASKAEAERPTGATPTKDKQLAGSISARPAPAGNSAADLDTGTKPAPMPRHEASENRGMPSKGRSAEWEGGALGQGGDKDSVEKKFLVEAGESEKPALEKPALGERPTELHAAQGRQPRPEEFQSARPATQRITEPALDRAKLVSQVAERIEALAAARPRQGVTIHLEPRDLGSITLVVKAVGTEVEAKLLATDDGVRAALAENRAALQGALESKGYSLSQVSVGHATSDAGLAWGQQQRHGPQEHPIHRHLHGYQDPGQNAPEFAGLRAFAHRGFEIYT